MRRILRGTRPVGQGRRSTSVRFAHDRVRGAHRPAEHDDRRAAGLWTRIEDLGFDWISIWDHFYSRRLHRATTASRRWRARRAGVPHAAGALRVARVLRRLPPPRRAGQRHRHDRPPLRAAGPTSASAPAGRSTSTTPTASPFPRPGERLDLLEEVGRSASAACCATRSTDFAGRALHAHRGALRPAPGAGRAADLDRRRRREAHAAHRRPLRRRLERRRSSRPRSSPTSATSSQRHCADVGRDPAEIRCAVNVGLAVDEDALRASSARSPSSCAPACSSAPARQLVDRVGRVRRRRRRPGQHRPPGAVGARRPRSPRRRARTDLRRICFAFTRSLRSLRSDEMIRRRLRRRPLSS